MFSVQELCTHMHMLVCVQYHHDGSPMYLCGNAGSHLSSNFLYLWLG